MFWVLGILIRSVINFEFVYDIDSSLMIDYYFDVDGWFDISYNEDFVW